MIDTPILWMAWSAGLRIVHVIQPRGYIVTGAIIGRSLTVRAFPILHGPVTRDGSIGWDPIDLIPIPRRDLTADTT